MDNNSILRRLRYTFDLNDRKMIALFGAGALEVTREQVSAWLKRDEDPEFVTMADIELAHFLNGFIIDRRGKRDGPAAPAEERLNNNIVLRKLKIALDLRDDDLVRLIELGGMIVRKPELTAFFRKAGHKHYRECQDQFLRKFLKGVQLEYRAPEAPESPEVTEPEEA